MDTLLCKDLVTKKYTDVELILTDPDNLVAIHVHRAVLGLASDYFSKLFDKANGKICASHDPNGTNVSGCNSIPSIPSITIGVPNAQVAHDVILTCYGKKINSTDLLDWHYLLETFNCRTLFHLEPEGIY